MAIQRNLIIKGNFIDACKQLINYVYNLKEDDYQNHREVITSAFIMMAVSSRKIIWKKKLAEFLGTVYPY